MKVSTTEIHCEGQDFSFYCKPYLLKLKLPFCVVDDERCRAVIDLQDDDGAVTIHLPKQDHGKYFPDLDLSTKLLSPQSINGLVSNSENRPDYPIPKIEVLSSKDHSNPGGDENSSSGDHEEDRSTRIAADELNDFSLGSSVTMNCTQYYGFNNMYCKVFSNLREIFGEALELKDPEGTPSTLRRLQRRNHEEHLFDPDRYYADYMGAEQDYIYVEAMNFIPHWEMQFEKWTVENTAEEAFDLTGGFDDTEYDAMQNKLPRREYLINDHSKEQRRVLLGLLDILFSYCYDHRMNTGDENVESSLNICRLSASLSWLESYEFEDDNALLVILHAMRRSLIYPYFRHWEFSKLILGDCAKILLLGKKCILRSLLQVRKIFEFSEIHYIFNRLFINDYCAYIQGVDGDVLKNFAKEVEGSIDLLTKESLGLNLLEIEELAETEDSSEDDDCDSSSSDDAESSSFSEEEHEEYTNLHIPRDEDNDGEEEVVNALIQDLSEATISRYDESIEALD